MKLLCLLLATSASAFSVHKATTVTSSSSLTTTKLQMSAAADTDKTRVVVTGLGVVSGCGVGAETFFQSCLDGKSSLGKVQRFDADAYPCQIASEVPAEMFDPADHFINRKSIRSNDRYTHFAVAAARQALKDGNVGDTPDTMENPSRVGVMVGSAFGGMETFEKETLKLNANPSRPKVRIGCREKRHGCNGHIRYWFDGFRVVVVLQKNLTHIT